MRLENRTATTAKAARAADHADLIADAYEAMPWHKNTDLAHAIRRALPEDQRPTVKTITRRIAALRQATGKSLDDSRRERILEMLAERPRVPDVEIRAELGLNSHDACKVLVRAAREEAGAPNNVDRMKQVRRAVGELIAEQDNPVTTRQGYYLATARGIVEKTEAGYHAIQRLLVDMRRKGEVPWSAIEDRTRFVDYPQAIGMKSPPERWQIAGAFEAGRYGLTQPEDVIRYAVEEIRRDFRETADPPDWTMIDGPRPIVLIEKDALFPAVRDEAHRLNSPVISTRGFSSLSQMRDLAARIAEDTYVEHGHVLLWLHDWDTAGDRMENASLRTLEEDFGQYGITVRHVALTEEQVAEWSIQTRPDKQTAGRKAAELDAIPPGDFRRIVREAIESYIPEDHEARVQNYVGDVNRAVEDLIESFVYEEAEDGKYYSSRIAFLVDRDNYGAQHEDELDGEACVLGRHDYLVHHGATIEEWKDR